MVKWTNSLSKYYILHRVGLGKCQGKEIAEAKEFLSREFTGFNGGEFYEGEFSGGEEVSDRKIIARLWRIYKSEGPEQPLAESCLRCVISHYLKKSCDKLAQQYGAKHNFTVEDLLPFVLDCNDRSLNGGNNKSLTVHILETFDSDKGSLSAWVQRKVIGDSQLKMFLLENGLELRTNWSLLKQCTTSKLRHILSDFYQYEPNQIQQFTELLESYHTVYLGRVQAARNQINQEREKQGLERKQTRYPEPNRQQLLEMAERLSPTWKLSPEEVRKELQNLAELIREYRVSRGKSVATQALGKTETILAAPQAEEDNEVNKLLADFSQKYDSCFLRAVQEVVEDKIRFYRNKKKPEDKQFIQALRLYHCQMVSMGKIALQIGLNNQSKVSRLLGQKEIRADIARKIVNYLIPEIFQIIPEDISLEKRRELRTELPQILMEKVNEEMEQAQKEDSVSKNRTMDSKLSQAICQYLDLKSNI